MADDSSALPVFAYVDDKVQILQLGKYFASLGASVTVAAEDERSRGDEDPVEKIHELAKHCSVVVAVVQTFCEQLSSRDFQGAKAGAAVRVLSNLFHGFGDKKKVQHSLQYDIYCCMLRIAADNSGVVSELPTDMEILNDWFQEWQIDTENRRACLRLLHKAFRGQQSEAASKVMIELLRTYTTADASKALADARECVRSAIGDPGTFLFAHLLAVLPVQCLEKGDPKVYRMLKIFVSGYLEDYQRFYEEEKEFIAGELGLDHEALLNKMRILTLMSVGEEKEEVSFEELSRILNLTQGEELEEFVIRTVQSKAVIAKMDQVHQRLRIGGVKNRRFEKPQWEQLRNRLDAWAGSLRQVKRHVDQVLVPG